MLKYVRVSTWIKTTINGTEPHRFISVPIAMNRFNNEFSAEGWLAGLLENETYHITLELVPPPSDGVDYSEWDETNERSLDGKHYYTLTRN
jgi:hypothetical protein